jgi:hypothetical protein
MAGQCSFGLSSFRRLSPSKVASLHLPLKSRFAHESTLARDFLSKRRHYLSSQAGSRRKTAAVAIETGKNAPATG